MPAVSAMNLSAESAERWATAANARISSVKSALVSAKTAMIFSVKTASSRVFAASA